MPLEVTSTQLRKFKKEQCKQNRKRENNCVELSKTNFLYEILSLKTQSPQLIHKETYLHRSREASVELLSNHYRQLRI